MENESKHSKITEAKNNSDGDNKVESGTHSHHHHRHSHGHRHHHSHSHSRSHSRHRSSSSKKNNKIVSYLKRNKNTLINIISCSVSVVLLVVLAFNVDKKEPTGTDTENSEYTEFTKSTIKIETSIYPKKVSLVSSAISYYLDSSNDSTAIEAYRAFDGYKGGLNQGVSVPFIYRVIGLPSDTAMESAELYISESDSNDPGKIYKLDANAENINISNLKTGARYEYRLSLTLTNGCVIGTTGSFETEKSPRILTVDGAINVRDIGGYSTADGKIVKQGLLFRGSEIDGAVESGYLITDKGLQQIIGELGVRFDMDLRSPTDNKNGTDALGRNVIHKYYNSPMYSDILNDNGQKVVKSVFADLANPDNYPIYLHCTYGRDRTGTICYLLEALLGMSDEDLYLEYELSLFTDSYVNYAEFETFRERIRALDGETTKEKVENWMLSIGVSAEQINSIREIFLGE